MKRRYSYPLQNGKYTEDNDYPSFHWDEDDSVDFIIPEGTPVYAMYSGKAYNLTGSKYNTYPSDPSNQGICIGLRVSGMDNGGDAWILYTHLSKIAVDGLPDSRNDSIGVDVVSGQLLGYSGNTGYSDGAHLHLQIRSSMWSGEFEHGTSSRESYRLAFSSPPSSLKITDKLCRRLQVKSNPIHSEVVNSIYMSNLQPNEIGWNDEVKSKLAQLCCDELAFTGDLTYDLMCCGVYAKLMRNMFIYQNGGTVGNILSILQRYGGFQDWSTRGYPTLQSVHNTYATELLEIVEQNILRAAPYKLADKPYLIASWFPIQNYGYAGVLGSSKNNEPKLEQKILSGTVPSHLTTNSATTYLIGCLGNTGFFTFNGVLNESPMGRYTNTKTLISQ